MIAYIAAAAAYVNKGWKRRMSLIQPVKEYEICYRCGQEAWQNLSGNPYCPVCFFVVEALMDMVRHDPPPGFPGARAGAVGWHQKMMDRLGKDFNSNLERKR